MRIYNNHIIYLTIGGMYQVMCKGLETAARFSVLQLYELSQFYAAYIYMYIAAVNMHNHVCNYIIAIARRILKN